VTTYAERNEVGSVTGIIRGERAWAPVQPQAAGWCHGKISDKTGSQPGFMDWAHSEGGL